MYTVIFVTQKMYVINSESLKLKLAATFRINSTAQFELFQIHKNTRSCTPTVNAYQCPNIFYAQACFIRRISVAPNAVQRMDNEMTHFIIYCSNCVRRGCSATYKTDLTQ